MSQFIKSKPHESAIALEQWTILIQTQIHFNDMILRTRSLVVTVVLAAYGAAAACFTQVPDKYIATTFGFFHVSVAITVFALNGKSRLRAPYLMR